MQDEQNGGLLRERVTIMEQAVREIRSAVQQIAEATTQIARLEVRHQETRESLGRAFKDIGETDRVVIENRGKIEALSTQVALINERIVPLQETRKWIIGGILSIVGIVGAAVVSLVMVAPK